MHSGKMHLDYLRFHLRNWIHLPFLHLSVINKTFHFAQRPPTYLLLWVYFRLGMVTRFSSCKYSRVCKQQMMTLIHHIMVYDFSACHSLVVKTCLAMREAKNVWTEEVHHVTTARLHIQTVKQKITLLGASKKPTKRERDEGILKPIVDR